MNKAFVREPDQTAEYRARIMMPSRSIITLLLVSLLLAYGTASVADNSFQSLAPGLEYRHERRANGPLSIHVLRIDRQQGLELHTILGKGAVYGLEPLPGIVARAAAQLKKPALAAINGDFFLIKPGPYQGDPSGLHITEGELTSRPGGNSFWVAANGDLRIGPVESKLRVVWPDGKAETALGLNETCPDDKAVLYTPTLGLQPKETPKEPPTTRTKGGKELVLKRVEGRLWLPIQAGRTYSARVAEIRDGGSSPLQANKLIVSIGPKMTLPSIKVGDILQLVMETNPNLEGVKTAVGTHRILIEAGKSPDLGPSNQPRHPRSMIGWNEKYLFFTVVDGRQKGVSIGVTYPEMAALMKEYGWLNTPGRMLKSSNSLAATSFRASLRDAAGNRAGGGVLRCVPSWDLSAARCRDADGDRPHPRRAVPYDQELADALAAGVVGGQYLIGEKFINFLEAADTDAAFRAEIPAFVAEIKTSFERWQLADYLERARQTEPFDPSVYEDTETAEMERRAELRNSAADLLLVERARDWLLGEE